jgi:hypothetical protein
VAFGKDHWGVRLTVYFAFAIELLQTIMMMVDRYQVFVIDFAQVKALDLHLRMCFSASILSISRFPTPMFSSLIRVVKSRNLIHYNPR